MDFANLCSVLAACMSTEQVQRSAAEEVLKQVCFIASFAPGETKSTAFQTGWLIAPPYSRPVVCAAPTIDYRRPCMQHETVKGQVVHLLRVAAEEQVDAAVR